MLIFSESPEESWSTSSSSYDFVCIFINFLSFDYEFDNLFIETILGILGVRCWLASGVIIKFLSIKLLSIKFLSLF